jgi:hypothetical protein
MISGFKPYNKEELFKLIDAIEIVKVGEQVVTKYFNRVINTSNVSNRYEIFDIRSFLKDKILSISSNFNISFYKFVMKRGTQELTLLSDSVLINKTPYYKAFFILNSSDKSRRLNMNLGLYRSDNNVYLVSGVSNMSLCRKHLTGLTQVAEESAVSFNGETFNEQIDSIKSLVGEKVMFSKLREIIVDKDQKISHRKFDALKNQFLYSNVRFTDDQFKTLRTPSEKLVFDSKNDFPVDAYLAFNYYIQVFRNQDSYVVKKETERIIKITQWFIRNEKLSQLLDLV